MENFLQGLNAAQKEAVSMIQGPALVIAGPGSGKTRVIEHRVPYLIQNAISPQKILLLTFTRRAAREMLQRAEAHDMRCARIEGGTFHSFAAKMLRKYADYFGLRSSFSIFDEHDAQDALWRIAGQLGFLEDGTAFPKKETLRSIFSQVVNKRISIENVLQREYSQFYEYREKFHVLEDSYRSYKKKYQCLDFDDLLVFLKLLLEDGHVRKVFAERYEYVMVDEYQDTNAIQGDISYFLAKEHSNIMIVGDDAQSIYGFRGATHANIMQFPERFPRCKIIKLESNYRSTGSILDFANAILKAMEHKYEKTLISARGNEGEKPRLCSFYNPYEEASWITKNIRELCDQGHGISRQAVLFRSSYLSIPLQAELSKAGISYEVFGGLKFYETAHVKDLLAYLRILANFRDELAWSRVLGLLPGVGPRTTERLVSVVVQHHAMTDVLLALRNFGSSGKFSHMLLSLVSVLEKLSNDNTASVEDQVGAYLVYYYPIFKDRFDDWRTRADDLEVVKQMSSRYNSLSDFLSDFSIEPPHRNSFQTLHERQNTLTLSTIHSAKGLEWDVVHVIGLADGMLPTRLAFEDSQQMEEERRLFYVAVTRAKDFLFLSYHEESRGSRFGNGKTYVPSRFLTEGNAEEYLVWSLASSHSSVDEDSKTREDEDGIIYY